MKRYMAMIRCIGEDVHAEEVFLAFEVEAEHLKLSTERLQAIDAMQKMELKLKAELAKKDEENNRLILDNSYLVNGCKEKDEEIARLIESYNKAVDPIEDDVKRQKEENARLKGALEFYADTENYQFVEGERERDNGYMVWEEPTEESTRYGISYHKEPWGIAREALAPEKEEGE
jgi:hypothetical protein